MTSARHTATYRVVLHAYPRSFRRDYGDAMTQLFADRVRDVGAKAWLRVVPDLARSVPQQRIEAVMSNLSTGKRVVGIVAFVILLAVATFGLGGPGVVLPVVGAVALLAASQRRYFRSMVGGDRIRLHRSVVQTWWAPAAAVIAAGEIALGIDNAFSASNWGGRTFGAVVPVLIGAAMLYGLMRRPFARAAGNGLILLATIPALMFFWAVLPPLLAIVVWIGVLSSGFDQEPAIASSALVLLAVALLGFAAALDFRGAGARHADRTRGWRGHREGCRRARRRLIGNVRVRVARPSR